MFLGIIKIFMLKALWNKFVGSKDFLFNRDKGLVLEL